MTENKKPERMIVEMRKTHGQGSTYLSEDEQGRIVFHDYYFPVEPEEEDFEFDYRFTMKRSDYMQGLKELRERGSCSIPISDKTVHEKGTYSGPDTVSMELIEGKVKICNKQTPWTLTNLL